MESVYDIIYQSSIVLSMCYLCVIIVLSMCYHCVAVGCVVIYDRNIASCRRKSRCCFIVMDVYTGTEYLRTDRSVKVQLYIGDILK